MKRFTTNWTMALTAATLATLLSLPASGAAQPPSPASPTATQPPAPPQQQAPTPARSQPNASAPEHLAKAKAAVNDINAAALTARVKTQVAEVKRRLNTLDSSTTAPSTAGSAGRRSSWGTEVAAIDKTLTNLLGPDSAAPGIPTATGTSGTAAPKNKTAPATLDEASRAKLVEVRTHLTAFAVAMAGGQPSPTSETSTAPATTPAPPAAAPSDPTTATVSSSIPSQPNPEVGARPAQEPEAARRHITEARNTLSALTQLPAASQLTGESRTQVSQLISNFNELITTQSEWRASYAKVSANLAALLGPDTGVPDPSSASGTAGAVGTSGSATPNLDPAVREKLVELRRNLSAFEKVAGGVAANTATPSAASPTDPKAPTSTPAGAPPSAIPPAPSPSTTTPSTSAPSTTPVPENTTSSQSTSSSADIMRHVAAIEAMLKMENEGGGLTLTKTQVEQFRTHWAALRQALDKK